MALDIPRLPTPEEPKSATSGAEVLAASDGVADSVVGSGAGVEGGGGMPSASCR